MTNMQWLEGRRTNIQIITEILRLLRLDEVGKTEIMYTINMSYFQTQKYLSLILERGLADKQENEHHMVSYRITKKGAEFLAKVENMLEMLHNKETPHILDSPEVIKGVTRDSHRSLSR